MTEQTPSGEPTGYGGEFSDYFNFDYDSSVYTHEAPSRSSDVPRSSQFPAASQFFTTQPPNPPDSAPNLGEVATPPCKWKLIMI